MRKIIQVFAHEGVVTCLCDDGTVWSYIRGKWENIDVKEIVEGKTLEECKDDINKFVEGF